MLAARGFRGITISELAERVGMTAPGLLYYFGDKDGLLHAVVDERQRIERGEFYEETPDEDVTIRVLPVIAAANAETPELVRLYLVLAMENLDEGDPLHTFFVERYERARRLARQALNRDIERGLLRDDLDVAQVAGEVIATLIGFEVQWLMDPDRFDYVASMTAYIEGVVERFRRTDF